MNHWKKKYYTGSICNFVYKRFKYQTTTFLLEFYLLWINKVTKMKITELYL